MPCEKQDGPLETKRAHGGELGIRTPDTLLGYTRLAGEHLRPLGQLSVSCALKYNTTPKLVSRKRVVLVMENSAENIILIGMPGAGKSSVGVVLAKVLNYDFLDCDLLIQRKYGKTLQEIIDTEGNAAFITKEDAVLKTIQTQQTIISTGGSAIYSDEAMAHLKTLGTVIYLEVSFEEMVSRLSNLDERGVVMKDGKGMSLEALYEEREPLYSHYADVTVNVEGLSITDAARKIAQMF